VPGGVGPWPIPVASRRPRSSPALDVCGIRLGPAPPCVLGLLGSRPRPETVVRWDLTHSLPLGAPRTLDASGGTPGGARERDASVGEAPADSRPHRGGDLVRAPVGTRRGRG